MVRETVDKMAEYSRTKIDFLNKSFSRYFVYAMLAGIYVGFAIILVYTIGAPFKEAHDPAVKALMGVSFAVALTLVIFAGSELFTGNNMVMVIGNLEKKVTIIDTLKIWIVSYFGNMAGSLLLGWGMANSGLVSKNPQLDFVLSMSNIKMTAPFTELLIRGILCNMLVCLAVWTSMRTKEDTAKLILIFWCLFAFIGSGFEHSIANMTLFGMALFLPHDPSKVSWMGFINNLIPVTLGNIIGGGFFIGTAYWFVASKDKK